MHAWGVPPSKAIFESLERVYAESHRHYHTAVHIDHCLQELDLARSLAQDPAEVELALWYHDAIYDVHSATNEVDSADLMSMFLRSRGVKRVRIERVRRHILATAHADRVSDPDSQLVLDIDLAILGAPPSAYRLFEAAIRQEYAWVSEEVFRAKRAEILQGFLDRPSIYHTQAFRGRYELQARANLTTAIRALHHFG